MLYDTETTDREAAPARGGRRRRRGTVAAALPSGLVLTERAVAALRRFLRGRRLRGWRIFHCRDLDLHDVERHLDALGEAGAAWEAPPANVPGGEPLVALTHGNDRATLWEAGFLHLPGHDVVLARWHWVGADGDTYRNLWLCAAPSTQQYLRLRREVVRLRHEHGQRVWQVVRGAPYSDAPSVPRSATPDDLVFPAALRQRIESDILRFFEDDVAALYRSLRVPHRRGVLLHGPPGNGKTSLIRLIGARLPRVPCMLLRPAANFDTDDLEEVIRRWRQQAPAVLVIEDLDWLLEHTNVSTFLNLIDGVESDAGQAAGGLLLIATTNHPDKLDPAVNNRPGRFDVVVEIPSPGEGLRAEFFRRELSGLEPRVIGKLASATDGLSFAHLQEVLRLSGLAAIHAGRSSRSADDLHAAARTVRAAHREAMKGFPIRPDMPFGLGHLVRGREDEQE